MKKIALILIFFCALSETIFADNFSNLYFEKTKIKLTAQERAALKISEKWANSNPTGIKPFTGPDGSIKFLFGAQYTSIVCAVLQICDIELQPGEQINTIKLGDKVRWEVEPAVTGFGSNQVLHLIIKPKDVNLVTSLVVTTDRRTYRLRLKSTRNKYMPAVSFSYPEDSQAKWEAIKKRNTIKRKNMTNNRTGEYLGNLDFNYQIEGETSWKPVRVYNDGVKTIIQMPSTMTQTEAPTLLVVRKEGGVFSDDETVMVNYRVQNERYIVDSVFNKAILISGVGSDQDKIIITRTKGNVVSNQNSSNPAEQL